MEARKLRLKIATACFAVSAMAAMAVPVLASADDIGTALNSAGLGGTAPSSSPATSGGDKAGVPPTYVPPLHGTNPHGQGTPASVEIAPTADNPYTGTITLPETLIVGRSKGEQNPDGTYHGHVTIASLGGNELLGINTTPGQTADGPLQGLQVALLNQICTNSGGQLCLGLLQAHSHTDGSGSQNSFSALSAQVGPVGQGIKAGVLTSSGNISDDGTCQTADGHSSVADANVGGATGLTAGLSHSNSTSTACNNGTAPTVTQDSSV
ncbi:MAG: hypothetical protein ABR536_01485, partial [Solirubrobacterales bacterium]